MSERKLLGMIGWFVAGSSIVGGIVSMLLDYGTEYPAYTVGYKHILSFILMTVPLVITGYWIGRSEE